MLDPRDSTTYQAILRDGRIGGGQRILIRLGTKTLGKCDSATYAQSKRFEISTCSPSCVSEFLTRTCATGTSCFGRHDPPNLFAFASLFAQLKSRFTKWLRISTSDCLIFMRFSRHVPQRCGLSPLVID